MARTPRSHELRSKIVDLAELGEEVDANEFVINARLGESGNEAVRHLVLAFSLACRRHHVFAVCGNNSRSWLSLIGYSPYLWKLAAPNMMFLRSALMGRHEIPSQHVGSTEYHSLPSEGNIRQPTIGCKQQHMTKYSTYVHRGW